MRRAQICRSINHRLSHKYEILTISSKACSHLCMGDFTKYTPLCHIRGLQFCSFPSPYSLAPTLGAHYTERPAEECAGCPGGKDSNPGLVWEWHQARSSDEQVEPERGGHWWGWALSPTDWRLLPVFAVQGWALQSGLWIQWHCQGTYQSKLNALTVEFNPLYTVYGDNHIPTFVDSWLGFQRTATTLTFSCVMFI